MFSQIRPPAKRGEGPDPEGLPMSTARSEEATIDHPTPARPAIASRERAPGPRGLPWFGSLFPAWRDPISLFLGSRAAHGDVVRFRFGPFEYYLVSDPAVVKRVLVDNAKAYRKSRNYLGLKILLGEGLLTSEGETWRRQRKLAQPAFHREHLAGFAASMAASTRTMLARWRAEDQEAAPAPRELCIHAEMMRLTFNVVGLTLFSSDVDGVARQVGGAMEVAMHWANEYAESLVRLPPYVPTPANLRFRRAKKTLDDVVAGLIAERRAVTGPDQPRDLLGMLMAATDADADGAEAKMSDVQLRDEIITMILAGHETTANLLSWTFFLLSKHPEVERRVREEARTVLGDRDPTLADVKMLEYTRQVIEEVLRLYPPAWIFERQSTEADVLGRYPIEPGSIVAISPFVLHRHPALWDNPEGFDPARFAAGESDKRSRYQYLPFGGGPRFCPGNQFAMMEAQILLAMIVRDHRLELVPEHAVVLDPSITLRPKHGIRVRRLPASPAPVTRS